MNQQPDFTTPPRPSGVQSGSAPQPVAYDQQGRPLYAAPPVQAPQYVHLARAIEPSPQEIPPEIKVRHDESVRLYPNLNLSEAEFVISAVQRHPIGLVLPVAVTLFLVAFVASLLVGYDRIVAALGVVSPPSFGVVLPIGTLLILLILLLGYIPVWIYRSNRFFLTNESVIQEIQMSLFSRREQTVSLANIEDASFTQQGILQSLFGYGSIRLSTEGDETTYRFQYVTSPKEQIAILNNAVEAFKNGRPVTGD